MLIRKTALLEVNRRRKRDVTSTTTNSTTDCKHSTNCLSSTITSSNIEKLVCYNQQQEEKLETGHKTYLSSSPLPKRKTSDPKRRLLNSSGVISSINNNKRQKYYPSSLCFSLTKLNHQEQQQQYQLANPKTNSNQSQLSINKYYNSLSHRHHYQAHKMITTTKQQIIYFPTITMATLFALVLVLLSTTTTTHHFVYADSALLNNMQKLKISPDIIQANDQTGTIKVELHGNVVKPGDPVPAKHFKDLNMGKINWEVDQMDNRHTLVLLDLDRKAMGPINSTTQNIYNQFTSLNIPGNLIHAGQTIVAFDPPMVPCQPSTKHRILMLAFLQEQNIDISDIAYMSASSGYSPKRENFKLGDFIQRHRLHLVAANVFLAIGESNGICSAGMTLHSINSLSIILIAMVMTIAAYAISSTSSIKSAKKIHRT